MDPKGFAFENMAAPTLESAYFEFEDVPQHSASSRNLEVSFPPNILH